MGDLGGGAGDATHFMGISDFNKQAIKTNFTIGYDYRLFKRINIHNSIRLVNLYGSDKFTANEFRHNRNLDFNTRIIEYSLNVKYYLKLNKQFIERTVFTSLAPRYRFSSYLLVGIGAFHYNPKAKHNDVWVDLRPLRTEGQELEPYVYNGETISPLKEYSMFAMNINVGLGVEYLINHHFIIGIEISNRYTTTDYIDDVHSYYYPNEILVQNYGELSGIMADRRIDNSFADANGENISRGGKEYNDAYLLSNIVLRYVF